MKIIISGSRYYTNKKKIENVLSKLPTDTIVVHGNCRGADRISASVASRLGMTVISYQAEWDKYGKSAGPKRNLKMIQENPDIDRALIFHELIENSLGTKDMITKLSEHKIPFDIYD